MMRLLAGTQILLITAATLSAARADDWPAFRGPQGDGHSAEKNLPVHWSNTENIVWKKPIPGEGWSSPVVVQSRVYLTAAVPNSSGANAGYSLRLLSLDAESGKSIFNQEVFKEEAGHSPPIHKKNSHASPTPLVTGNRIYLHFGHQGSACMDLAGKLVWQNRELRYPPVHGAGGTPVVVDNGLVVSCDGASDPFLAALDAASGHVLWKVPRQTEAPKKFSFSTPTVITVGGRKQVVSPGSDVVNALDPRTGKEIWHARYDGYSVIPKPVFGHGLIYICTGYDTPSLMAIQIDGKGDVTDTHVKWTETSSVPHTPSLLLVGDDLFMVSDRGIASCLDATTGKSVWQKRLGGDYSASPIYADGSIYFLSEDGTTTVVKAARTYEIIATNSIDGRTLASLAVSGSKIFLRSDKHLYCIGEK